MRFIATDLPEILLIEPDVFRDARGFFLETFNERKYREGGIDARFVQDNHSRSARGTLRGLHAQRTHPQGKLIRVIEGEIFDVAVDIRRRSPTFRQWVGVTLSAASFRQCWLPPGFANGFCVTSEAAEVEYRCTDFYDPEDEIGFLWSDPDVGVAWPVTDPILSAKDRSAPRLREILERLPA